MKIDPSDQKEETVPLSKSADFLRSECRMVLPGIQALFGFQLVAVFNSSFFEILTPAEQKLHVFALFLNDRHSASYDPGGLSSANRYIKGDTKFYKIGYAAIALGHVAINGGLVHRFFSDCQDNP